MGIISINQNDFSKKINKFTWTTIGSRQKLNMNLKVSVTVPLPTHDIEHTTVRFFLSVSPFWVRNLHFQMEN